MIITCIVLLPAGRLFSFSIEMQLQLFNTRLAHNFFLQLNLEAGQRISHWIGSQCVSVLIKDYSVIWKIVFLPF